MIPLIQTEAVDNYGRMTSAQFTDSIAVANALPGPIATKIASYIGFRVASWPGGLVALTATVLPTVLIKYANFSALKAMLKGVRPVVAALLAVVVL